MKILVTGAAGFVGGRVKAVLECVRGAQVSAGRRDSIEVPGGEIYPIDGLDPDSNWLAGLSGQQVVVHAAGLAHVVNPKESGKSEAFHRVNVEGTLNLARQSAQAGVGRFIFISSVGVNGFLTSKPFLEIDTPNPVDFYAQSKFDAEARLWEVEQDTGMEIVIIRPPLVYGPNAPGNFANLARWVERGIPLPLGSSGNQRSFVAIDNLVDLIITCIDHPNAANEVFLAGDGHDLSTTELLQGVAKAMGKPSRLISVPPTLLMLAATLIGKKATADRLLGNLQVDISKARDLLGWEPPISVEEGLRRCFE